MPPGSSDLPPPAHIQNTAYSGTDLIPFSNPKFFLEILRAYSDLYLIKLFGKIIDYMIFPNSLVKTTISRAVVKCRAALVPADSFSIDAAEAVGDADFDFLGIGREGSLQEVLGKDGAHPAALE